MTALHASLLLQQDLVKICQVLATTFADDGCIPTRQRRALATLAAKLDGITRTEK